GTRHRDDNFRTIVQIALDNDKPVRIGVNWGSLDQQLLTVMMDENAGRAEPHDARDVYIEAMLASALRSAELAEEVGLRHDQILVCVKVSRVHALDDAYGRLASRCDYLMQRVPTEAGLGTKEVVSSSDGLSTLLAQGIGNIIRETHTPRH